MKRMLVLAVGCVLWGGVANAYFCARDNVPAATLLVPWAVVDLNADGTPNPAGWTTLFAATNTSAGAVLIHVTMWDVQANPVATWNEILSGYDVWTINFRDVLTGHFELFDTGTSLGPGRIAPPPYGPSSNSYTTALASPVDASVPAGCDFPYGTKFLSMGPLIVSKLQSAMYAQPSQQWTACGGPPFATPPTPPWLVNLASNPVWFYVTVDSVAACAVAFPNDTAYWTGGPVSNGGRFPVPANVLTGDVIWLNAATNYSDSVPAVHLEANVKARTAALNAFYDRYSGGGPISGAPTVEDDREPLPTAWGFRYLNNDGVSTQVMVWKTTVEVVPPPGGAVNACRPYVYYAWDENEHAKARGGGADGTTVGVNELPFATQSAPLNTANFGGLPANNGWMLIVFDPSLAGRLMLNEMSWVGVRYVLPGTPNYSTALEATVEANAWCPPDPMFP